MKKYIILLSITLAFILGVYLMPTFDKDYKINENITLYYENKEALIVEVQEYIDNVAPTSNLTAQAVVNTCLRYDMDIVFVLSQGEIESHFGTQGLAAKTNSVFNVGAPDNATYKTAKKYKTPDDSVEPYVRLLAKNYMVGDKTEEDLKRNFVNKKGQRYASDLSYESKLRQKCKTIEDTTNIKRIQEDIRKNTIKINS